MRRLAQTKVSISYLRKVADNIPSALSPRTMIANSACAIRTGSMKLNAMIAQNTTRLGLRG
jgi:hypothetical protein